MAKLFQDLGRRLSGKKGLKLPAFLRKDKKLSKLLASLFSKKGMPFVILFLLCYLGEFIHLYGEAMGKRESAIKKGEPRGCDSEKTTLYDSFVLNTKYMFSWTHVIDPCNEYYNVRNSWPFLSTLLSPHTVVVSMVTRSFTYVIESLSFSFGKSLALFNSNIPAQWQVVFMIIFPLIFIFLFVFVYYGYKVSIFGVASVGPSKEKPESKKL